MQNVEQKKRQLEENIDSLNEEIVRIRAQGELAHSHKTELKSPPLGPSTTVPFILNSILWRAFVNVEVALAGSCEHTLTMQTDFFLFQRKWTPWRMRSSLLTKSRCWFTILAAFWFGLVQLWSSVPSCKAHCPSWISVLPTFNRHWSQKTGIPFGSRSLYLVRQKT